MKRAIRVFCIVVATFGWMLCCCACSSSALEGTYLPEDGSDKMYIFTEEKVIFVNFVGDESYELHFTYEIEPSGTDGEEEQLILQFLGLYYDGSDTDLAYYLDGLLYVYQQEPSDRATLVRGHGYLEINGVKLIKQ